MTKADLERKLFDARDCEAALAALAEYFSAHELVFGHGTDSAGDEAFWLLRYLQQWRSEVDWDAPPERAIIAAAVELAARRVAERKPLAYLIGEAWFAGLRFAVDERVLVPRSPLAALEVAAANVASHGVGARVRLYRADLFPPTDVRYRVIVSNPPYVAASEMAGLPPEYRHEPAGALAGGPRGFEPAERILRGARERLTPDGCVLVEVGGGAEAFATAHPDLPLTWLTFERGGDGVLALTAAELEEFLRPG